MFPNGAADLVLYFYDQCNAKLFEKLKSGEFDAPTTVEFLESALWYRLSLIIPVIEHWPEAMARLSAPAVIPEALQRVKQLMDEITIHSGHRSLSLGWYGRRLTTTAVYKSTELFMLSDESVDKSNSREFLRRRLDGLRSVEDCQKLVTTDAPNVIAGVATIVQGVLGVASESVWGPKGVSSASVSEDRGSKKTSSSKSTGADPSSKSNGADPVATPP
ncbi:unnamed protein product [Cyprideis torosa]|uniref:Ubiquinone biosynthesis protein n=1 Tax=Cyprideis torosa TaxID=163714 RepID=A0A7R8W4R3_9CRUS|nr:unnamed protein product [Cyprideis torosa]CAG0884346.1 unnamed protein product [Cyprideis torosa]